MFRKFIYPISVLLCLLLAGCTLINIHSGRKEKIIREKEPRQSVIFENDAASTAFNREYESRLRNCTVRTSDGGSFKVLLICDVDDEGTITKLSPNAVYNDCVKSFDLDKNGIITEGETLRYAK